MSTGSNWKNIASALLLSSGLVCAGIPAFADAGQVSQGKAHIHRKSSKKKQPDPLPPLPSGPTGKPVQQIPLDSIAAVPPQVSFANNELTIVAPNSTLADILRAVRKQTGAEIEIPSAPERVVTHLGPGPAREIVAELLNGSRFNYVLLGSPSDQTALTRVVLVAKSGPQEITPNAPPSSQPQEAQAQPEAEPETPEGNEAEAVDESNNGDENNAEQQAAEAEQPPPDQQQGVKTPQQMLQEMQQRQMQLQQQQPPGQPPIPGSGMPPHPPQEN